MPIVQPHLYGNGGNIILVQVRKNTSHGYSILNVEMFGSNLIYNIFY